MSERRAPKAIDAEPEYGIPLFIEQLITTLQTEQTPETMRGSQASGPSGGGKPTRAVMGAAAARHGHELFQQGFTVEQVVHDYGDLCQVVTDLALERKIPVDVDEFRTLNRCLDDAIADAVTEFAYRRDVVIADREVHTLSERLGSLAHELRDLIQTATLAVGAIKAGNVGLAGATGALLDRSLIGLRTVIDRSLCDVRITAGISPRRQLISLAEVVADVTLSASLEAKTRGCALVVSTVDVQLVVDADRDLLCSAVGILLHNAFKFTRPGTQVSLNAYASADRILIDVDDRCGGLPPGASATMFRPFTQSGGDRSGLGLGLSICQRSVEANGGVLRVRDIPGSGCVFTIDLPRHSVKAAHGPTDPVLYWPDTIGRSG